MGCIFGGNTPWQKPTAGQKKIRVFQVWFISESPGVDFLPVQNLKSYCIFFLGGGVAVSLFV